MSDTARCPDCGKALEGARCRGCDARRARQRGLRLRVLIGALLGASSYLLLAPLGWGRSLRLVLAIVLTGVIAGLLTRRASA